jgi:DNA-binding NarL/FixJ family response regulator
MSTATRRSIEAEGRARTQIISLGNGHGNGGVNGNGSRGNGGTRKEPKPRVLVAAENRLLREALSRMLTKNGDIEVLGGEATEPTERPLQNEDLRLERAEILLLSSKGNLDQDLEAIRKVRSATPEVPILLIDVAGDEMNFLQCIRAGVRGYLPRDASAEDVVEAVRAIHAGKAVCPGTLCAALFRYLEREATCFPSASVHQRLGLTRREQQLVPLVAEGLTNKEIANRFCLSEQTVKNHLYRMKHKVGAEDRLGIVQVCRTQGFMV